MVVPSTATELEVAVAEVTKGGADKVLTPPSEPAVPRPETSEDHAAIEAAITAARDALEPMSHRIREARENPFRDASRPHASESIEEVAAALRKTGREWKDPDFGHADEEVFKSWPNGLDKSAVSWEPPSRYCTTRNPVGKNKCGNRTWLYCDFNGDGESSLCFAYSLARTVRSRFDVGNIFSEPHGSTRRRGDGGGGDEGLGDRAGAAR